LTEYTSEDDDRYKEYKNHQIENFISFILIISPEQQDASLMIDNP
jgi:hypothetical protein